MALTLCDRCGRAEAVVLWEHRLHGKLYGCNHCTRELAAQLEQQGWLRYPALPALSSDPATH